MSVPWDTRTGGVFTSGPEVTTSPAHGILEESSSKCHPLGTVLRVGPDVYRYCKASEALAAGNLATAVADSDAEDTVTVAHPISTTGVTVTAASAIAANQYEDGKLIVDEGTGAGNTYNVKDHLAISNAETGTINIYDGLKVAWSTSDTDIVLVQSPYVVQESNADQKETPICVPRIAVTSGYYFWGQTRGLCGVLQDEAEGNAAGQRLLTIGSSTAGSVESYDGAGEAIVGMRLFDAANDEDAKYQPAMLLLD